MKTEVETPRCSGCGGATKFIREVPPIGPIPGVRMFQCLQCDRAVWEDIDSIAQPSHTIAEG